MANVKRRQIQLNQSIFIESHHHAHRWIALSTFYSTSFESDSIRPSVRPQISSSAQRHLWDVQRTKKKYGARVAYGPLEDCTATWGHVWANRQRLNRCAPRGWHPFNLFHIPAAGWRLIKRKTLTFSAAILGPAPQKNKWKTLPVIQATYTRIRLHFDFSPSDDYFWKRPRRHLEIVSVVTAWLGFIFILISSNFLFFFFRWIRLIADLERPNPNPASNGTSKGSE